MVQKGADIYTSKGCAIDSTVCMEQVPLRLGTIQTPTNLLTLCYANIHKTIYSYSRFIGNHSLTGKSLFLRCMYVFMHYMFTLPSSTNIKLWGALLVLVTHHPSQRHMQRNLAWSSPEHTVRVAGNGNAVIQNCFTWFEEVKAVTMLQQKIRDHFVL